MVKGAAAIIVDADTGQVLYSKDAETRRPPASTTKMISALLLIENCKLDDQVTASVEASKQEGASLYMKPGETLTVRDILHGMLLRSANDASVVAAEKVGGSQARFVEMMNARARELGADKTTFRNCNGLYNPGHLTTAHDLARIAVGALRNPVFNGIVRTKSYRLSKKLKEDTGTIFNKCRLLWRYEGADGVKTGYLKEAGNCVVGAATRGGWRLVTVVLNSPEVYDDTVRMLDYGFANFQSRELARAGATIGTAAVMNGRVRTVQVAPGGPVRAVVRKGSDTAVDLRVKPDPVRAPAAAGAAAGTAEVWVDGMMVAEVPLVTVAALAKPSLLGGGLAWWAKLLLAAILLGGVWYASKVAKAARIRRYRLAALMRMRDSGR